MGYAQKQVSLSLWVNTEGVMIHEAAVCIFNSLFFCGLSKLATRLTRGQMK